MSETTVAIWAIALFVIILNGCAAGIAAFLHVRRKMGRGGKVVGAIFGSGLLTAGIFIPAMISDFTMQAEGALIIVLALLAIFVVAAFVSLPGALVITRRLEAPGDEYRAFE